MANTKYVPNRNVIPDKRKKKEEEKKKTGYRYDSKGKKITSSDKKGEVKKTSPSSSGSKAKTPERKTNTPAQASKAPYAMKAPATPRDLALDYLYKKYKPTDQQIMQGVGNAPNKDIGSRAYHESTWKGATEFGYDQMYGSNDPAARAQAKYFNDLVRASGGDTTVLTSKQQKIDNLEKQGLTEDWWLGWTGIKKRTNKPELKAAKDEYTDYKNALRMSGFKSVDDALNSGDANSAAAKNILDKQYKYTSDDMADDLVTIDDALRYGTNKGSEFDAAVERLNAYYGEDVLPRIEEIHDPGGMWMNEFLDRYDEDRATLNTFVGETSGVSGTDAEITADDMFAYRQAVDNQAEKETKLAEWNVSRDAMHESFRADPEYDVFSQHIPRGDWYTSAVDSENGIEKWDDASMLNDLVNAVHTGEYDEVAEAIMGTEHSDTAAALIDYIRYMSPEDVSDFNYIMNTSGYDEAFKFITEDIMWNLGRQYEDEKAMRIQQDIAENPWTAIPYSITSFGDMLASGIGGVASFITPLTGQEMTEYDPILSWSRGMNTKRGATTGMLANEFENASIAGLHVPSMLYNGAMSAADSAINTAIYGHMATPMMAFSAYGSSLYQNLESMDSTMGAYLDAAVDGGIEALTEYFSVEGLLDDTVSSGLKTFGRQLVTEPSEEVFGELLRFGYDTARHGENSEVNRQINELIAQGYSESEAEAIAARDFARKLGETIFTAAISGAAGGARGAVQQGVANYQTGKQFREYGEAEDYESLVELAKTVSLNKSEQKLLERLEAEIAAGGEQEADIEEVQEETAEQATPEASVNPAERLNQMNSQREKGEEPPLPVFNRNKEVTDTGTGGKARETEPEAVEEQAEDLAEEVKENPEAKADEVADKMTKATKTKGTKKVTKAQLGMLYRATMQKLDERAQDALRERMSFDVAKELKRGGVKGEKAKRLAESILRIQDGSFTQEDFEAVQNDSAARGVLSDWTQKVEAENEAKIQVAQIRSLMPGKAAAAASSARSDAQDTIEENSDFAVKAAEVEEKAKGKLISEDEESTIDGEAVKILGAAAPENKDGADVAMVKVQTADGTERIVEADSIAYSEGDSAAYELAQYAASYGTNADIMYNAYQGGQDVNAYAAAFDLAARHGSDGRNINTLMRSGVANVLTENQIRTAYEMGRGMRIQRSRQSRTARSRKGAGVAVGKVDMSAIRGVKLNKHQQSSVKALGTISKALGINVRLVESKADAEGRYSTENGSWNADTRTLTLDIHAGSNYAADVNYAMMDTAGHELTHYIKQFADNSLWNEYQDFVMSHLDTKMDIGTEIKNKMAQDSSLSRDDAIEEIIADASTKALGKITDQQIAELAESNPTLFQKIKNFLTKWIANLKKQIREAFGSGRSDANRFAKAMEDRLDEMAAKWNRMLVSASRAANEGKAQEKAPEAVRPKKAQQTTEAEAEAQPKAADKLFIPYAHIDERDLDSVKDIHTELFCKEVEGARVAFAAAAGVLMDDLSLSSPGQKHFIWGGQGDLTVTGQKRMTSSLLADMKDHLGWTWDDISNTLQSFINMGNADSPIVKNTIRNRRMEVLLHEMLTQGYTTIDGKKIAPWNEYAEMMAEYQGSRGDGLNAKIPEGAIPFEEYAFPEMFDDVKYMVREVDGKNVVWITDNILAGKPADQKITDFLVDYLTEHVGEMYTIIESGQRVYLGKDIPKEYAWSKYSQRIRSRNQQLYRAKARAASGIGEAINIASNRKWEKTKHPENKDAKYGVYKYDSKIAFPVVNSTGDLSGVQAYDVTLVIRNATNGKKYLYDIQNIKNDAVTANTLYFKSRGAANKAAQRESIISERIIAQDNETVKFSMRDAADEAVYAKETKQFRNWFKGSKIVNDDGSPKVMYHGTPYGGFTVFKDWQYFTENRDYADVYHEPSASSIRGRYNPATNPETYAVYLSVKKPFDTRDPKIRKIWQEEFYNQYSRTPLSDKGLPDWTDGIDLVEFIEDNGYDYDAIILDEGATGGYGEAVQSRGISVVVRSSNQIKSATDNIGTFDPNNPDIRYQHRDPYNVSDRELLANAVEGMVQNVEDLNRLKNYQKKISELNEKQRLLEQTTDRIAMLKKSDAKGNRDEIIRLQNAADVYAKQIERADAKLLEIEALAPIKKLADRQRAEYKAKLDAQIDERIRKYREKKDFETAARIAQIREKEADKRKTMRKEMDRLKRAAEPNLKERYRNKILSDVKRLYSWVATPTNKAHVPEFLKAPLGEFIQSIDYSSVSKLEGKKPGIKDISMAEALENLRRVLANVHNQKNIEQGAQDQFGYMDLPAQYLEQLDYFVGEVKKAMQNAAEVTKTPLMLLNADQLKYLSETIAILKHSVEKMNENFNRNQFESPRSAANATIEDMYKLKAKVKTNKALEALNSLYNWKNTTPYYAFQRMGKGGKAVFEGMQDGWDKMAQNSATLIEFAKQAFTAKQAKEWSKDIKTITLANGESVKMTVSQIMSLYCLNKREQAVGHLLGGGMRVAEINLGRANVLNQTENYTLTEADIAEMISALTAEQKAVADKLQEFMNTVCTNWGNEISMRRFGYKMFTEKFYFPIEVDPNNLIGGDDKQEKKNSMFRLLNMSAMKPLTPKANNALIVRDIFDVFTAHSTDIAKYNALALPILDMIRWYNHVEKSDVLDKEGRPTGQIRARSTQRALEHAYGSNAKQYIRKFMEDLNAEHDGGRNDGVLQKLMGNAKAASVGANVRVYFLQITSLPRAAYAINPKYLFKGMAKIRSLNPANAIKGTEAQDKIGIMKWKSLGFYNTDIARSTRGMVRRDEGFLSKLRGWVMKPAEWGDNWVSNIIYEAAKAEMKDKHPGVKPGTDAYETLLNKRVREIVYKTQVVDSTMTRSDLMRSKGMMQIFTAFMSEPTLTVNMLNESVQEAVANRRSGMTGRENLKSVGGKAARALATFAFSACSAALIEALFDAFRDDDEYETFMEKFMDGLLGERVEDADTFAKKLGAIFDGNLSENMNIASMLPLFKDAISKLQGFEDNSMVLQVVDQFIDTYKAIDGWQKGQRPLYNVIYNMLKVAGSSSGVGVQNATRDGIAIWNTFFADAVDQPKVQTYENTKSDAAAAYYDAIRDDDAEKAEWILERAAINGLDAEDFVEKIKNLVKDDYLNGEIDEKTAKQYLKDYAGKTADKAEEQVGKWGYEKNTGGSYENVRDDYLNGKITEPQLRKYLASIEGLSEAKIDERIDRYKYYDHAGTSDGYTKYWRMYDAFENGGNFQKYAKQWIDAGVEKGDMARSIAGRYKEEYLAIKGTPAGDRMLERLLDLYVAIGYDREYERNYINKKWTLDK